MFADWIDTYILAHTPKGKKAGEYTRPRGKNQPPKGALSFRSLIGRNL